MDSPRVRILTNMAFWQSETWRQATDSIYDTGQGRDPEFLPWWREAWLLWRRAPAYDVVVTMGIRESMLYGLLCALTGRPSKQIMCEVFIDAGGDSLAQRIKSRLYRWVAHRALGILTNSTAEIATNGERFHLPPNRFHFVPLNSNIADPQRHPQHRGYILCAGRTLRDWSTLRALTNRDPGPFVLVAGRQPGGKEPWPPHVTLHEEIPRDRYLQILREAWIVVLPLLPSPRATGQVVFLEAMAMGKPVIATRGTGTVDYIRDGENGLLVPPGDAEALLRALRRLREEPGLYNALASQAVLDIQRDHTFNVHARRKLEAIASLVQARNGTGPS